MILYWIVENKTWEKKGKRGKKGRMDPTLMGPGVGIASAFASAVGCLLASRLSLLHLYSNLDLPLVTRRASSQDDAADCEAVTVCVSEIFSSARSRLCRRDDYFSQRD